MIGWTCVVFGGSWGILGAFRQMFQDTIQKTAVRSDFYIRDVFQSPMQNGQHIHSAYDYIWVNGISIQSSGNISCVNILYKSCETEDDCIKIQSQLLSLNPPIISGYIAPAIYPAERPFCTRIYFDIEYLSIDSGVLPLASLLGYLFVCSMVLLGFMSTYGRNPYARSHSVSPPSGDKTSPELPLPSTTVVAPPKSGEMISVV
jgi:hypothetical protein